ncbi:hypothetical protein Tco_0732408 [Tanacetum coccineum]
MSTPAYAQLVDTDIESDPEEAPSEVEELQSVGSRVPLMGEEFEAFEPIEAAALSLFSFCERYRSSYETSSSSLTLLGQKRYRGTSELILDTDSEGDELGEEDTKEDEEDESNKSQGLEGEGLGLEEEEEAAPEGQQQAVPIVDTAASEPLGLGYGAARRRALESIEEITPSTYEVGQSSRSVPEQEGVERISAFRQPTLVTWAPPSPEWSLGSLPVSPSFPVVPLPIASLVATLTVTKSVDEDQFIEVGAQLELQLYTRSRVVRDKIFSQRYRFRSLECEQERTAMTFGALWRPVLALEAWAGHAAMQRELQEMRGRVAALEQERGRKEP